MKNNIGKISVFDCDIKSEDNYVEEFVEYFNYFKTMNSNGNNTLDRIKNLCNSNELDINTITDLTDILYDSINEFDIDDNIMYSNLGIIKIIYNKIKGEH